MSKATTHESHWRERTGSHATKGTKRGVNLLGWEEQEWLSSDQERAALIGYAKRLDAVIASGELNEHQRRTAGLAKQWAERRANSIRPQLRKIFIGLEHFIIEVLKEQIPRAQYDAAVMEARKRWIAGHNARHSQPAAAD